MLPLTEAASTESNALFRGGPNGVEDAIFERPLPAGVEGGPYGGRCCRGGGATPPSGEPGAAEGPRSRWALPAGPPRVYVSAAAEKPRLPAPLLPGRRAARTGTGLCGGGHGGGPPADSGLPASTPGCVCPAPGGCVSTQEPPTLPGGLSLSSPGSDQPVPRLPVHRCSASAPRPGSAPARPLSPRHDPPVTPGLLHQPGPRHRLSAPGKSVQGVLYLVPRLTACR